MQGLGPEKGSQSEPWEPGKQISLVLLRVDGPCGVGVSQRNVLIITRRINIMPAYLNAFSSSSFPGVLETVPEWWRKSRQVITDLETQNKSLELKSQGVYQKKIGAEEKER